MENVLILVVLIAFVYFIWYSISEGSDFLVGAMVSVAFSFFTVVFIILISPVISDTKVLKDDLAYKVPIYSLNRGTSIEGHFVLGTGTVEGKQKYYYFEPSGEGYKLGEVDAKGLTIVEKDEQSGLEIHHMWEASPFKRWLLGTWFSTMSEEEYLTTSFDKQYVKRIVVPKGTIIKEYKVN